MPRARRAGVEWNETTIGWGGTRLRLMRVDFPVAVTVIAIKLLCTAADGNETLTPLIYDDSGGAPNNLVVEGSTHALASIGTATEVTIWTGSQNLSAGTYWVGCHADLSFTIALTFDSPSDAWQKFTSTPNQDPLTGASQSGSNIQFPHAVWAEWQEQTDTDDDTLEGDYEGNDPNGVAPSANQVSVRQFTAPDDGDISKVMVDIAGVGGTWDSTNNMRPVIYDNSGSAPNNLLATGPSIEHGLGQHELALSAPLTVSSGDVIWVGVHTEGGFTSAGIPGSNTAYFGNNVGAYAAGADDPFPSGGTSTGERAFGYSLDTGVGGGPGGPGGPGGDQPGTIRLFPTGLLRNFPVNSRHDDFLT